MPRNWHKRVLDALRWPAVIAGAAATSVGNAEASVDKAGAEWRGDGANAQPVILPNTLNATATDRYAAHRSHSSHRSHRSHRSSSGGGYTPSPTPSTPQRVQPAPRQVAPPTVVPKGSSTLPKPSAREVSTMVVRVQAALMRRGYFSGDIDGVLGPKTREAIMAFQKAEGLKQSGRMDIDTLSKLGISIP